MASFWKPKVKIAIAKWFSLILWWQALVHLHGIHYSRSFFIWPWVPRAMGQIRTPINTSGTSNFWGSRFVCVQVQVLLSSPWRHVWLRRKKHEDPDGRSWSPWCHVGPFGSWWMQHHLPVCWTPTPDGLVGWNHLVAKGKSTFLLYFLVRHAHWLLYLGYYP